jgi:hypothetical protein
VEPAEEDAIEESAKAWEVAVVRAEEVMVKKGRRGARRQEAMVAVEEGDRDREETLVV